MIKDHYIKHVRVYMYWITIIFFMNVIVPVFLTEITLGISMTLECINEYSPSNLIYKEIL